VENAHEHPFMWYFPLGNSEYIDGRVAEINFDLFKMAESTARVVNGKNI